MYNFNTCIALTFIIQVLIYLFLKSVLTLALLVPGLFLFISVFYFCFIRFACSGKFLVLILILVSTVSYFHGVNTGAASCPEQTDLVVKVTSSPKLVRPGKLEFDAELTLKSGKKLSYLIQTAGLPWNSLSVSLPGDFLRLSSVRKVQDLNLKSELLSYYSFLKRRGYDCLVQVHGALERIDFESREIAATSLLENPGHESRDLVRAVTLGEKSRLRKALKNAFQVLGLSHLLVVSGYHLAFLFSTFYFAVDFLARRSERVLLYISANQIAALAALLSCGVYTFLLTPQQSLLRAFVVMTIYTIGLLVSNRFCSVRAYLWCLVITQVIWPGSFLELGWQLTFSAVAGLGAWVWISKIFLANFSALQKVLANNLGFSLFAWLATAPILYLWQLEVSKLGFLSNATLSPLFSIWFILLGSLALMLEQLGSTGLLLAKFFYQISDKYVLELIWYLSDLAQEGAT